MLTLASDCAAFALTNEYGTSFSLPCSWHGSRDEEDGWRLFAFCTNLSQTGHVGNFVFTFTPDSSPVATLTRTVGVDVVKIRVEAEADWPSNKVRHVFGPKELFEILQTPQSPALSYSVDEGGSAFASDSGCMAPDVPGPFEIMFSANGCVGSLSFTCIAPTELHGSSPRPLTSDEWESLDIAPLQACEMGVAAHIETRVLPDYVSFAHIRLFEGVVLPSDRQGWYQDVGKFPDSMIAHDFQSGASRDPGVEYSAVDEFFNRTLGGDFIAAFVGPTNGCMNGSYTLRIPLKWYVANSLVTNSLPDNVQTIQAFANGTMRINKNGVTWERSLDGNEHLVEE